MSVNLCEGLQTRSCKPCAADLLSLDDLCVYVHVPVVHNGRVIPRQGK